MGAGYFNYFALEQLGAMHWQRSAEKKTWKFFNVHTSRYIEMECLGSESHLLFVLSAQLLVYQTY